MNIILDCREKALIDIVNSQYNNATSKSLVLGDILIQNKNNEDLVLFERKSINDLLSSIQDGRYEEQSFRLNNCELPNNRIYYIIEGNIENYKEREGCRGLYSKSTIYSCIYSISYLKGFNILLSNSLFETADIICKFANKLENEPNEASKKGYLDSVKITKKSHLSPEVVNILMLAQIPGVSKKSAELIINNFKSVDDFITNLRENNDCLNEITYQVANNKTRKLNKTCIANLKKYLLNIGE